MARWLDRRRGCLCDRQRHMRVRRGIRWVVGIFARVTTLSVCYRRSVSRQFGGGLASLSLRSPTPLHPKAIWERKLKGLPGHGMTQ